MWKWFADKAIDKFEKRWGYDAEYMRDIVRDCSFRALGPLQAMQKIAAFQKDVPLDTYYAAKLVAAKDADCGPCAQLVVSMAEAAGVDADVIRNVIGENRAALATQAALGYDFARAAIAADGSGDEVRAEILKRFGREGLLSLAYAVVAAQAFPRLKYALGHGHACLRLRVAGQAIPARPLTTA